MIITEVIYSEVYKDIFHMFQEHWNELGEAGGSSNLSIDHHLLMSLDSSGMYKCFTAEHDGKCIGYASWVISRGIHSASDIYATTDAVYVDKEYRESLMGAGVRLLKYSEKVLREKYKVNIIQFSMNINYDLGSLLSKMGYEISEIKYSKKLEG